MAQRQTPRPAQAAPTEILNQLNGGINTYTDPTLTNYKMWANSSNVFSGPFGFLQRARYAKVVAQASSPAQILSMKLYAAPGLSSYLLTDNANGVQYSYDSGANYASVVRSNPFYTPNSPSSMIGVWSREVLENIVYETNGKVKQTGRLANAATIEGWGLNAPDAAPAIFLNNASSASITSIQRTSSVVTATVGVGLIALPVGSAINITGVSDPSFNGTFIITSQVSATYTWAQIGNDTSAITGSGTASDSITKSIGRSYSVAWENANKGHVGPPSPSTQYIPYSAQNGEIQVFEAGQVNIGGAIVTQAATTTTNFSQAWVGQLFYVASGGGGVYVKSVESSTHLTLVNTSLNGRGGNFMIVPPDATHIRYYATADGGTTYFRIARNALNLNVVFSSAGLSYLDTAASEPPNIPFTTEISQLYNIPPPIGSFVKEYQGVLIVYGVPGAPQTLFYSNQTLTTIGLLQESFAPLNQITLPIQNASINGMAEFPGALIIWSDKQDMFRLTGLLTDNISATASQQGASIAALPYNLGCASPFAVALTPLGAIWLTPNAEVWLFTDAYAPRNIGRPIQTILQSINASNLSNARMTYYHNNNRNWVALSVAANGATYNNTILILDLDMLASNGQPSYFTFDMATNQPVWYVYNVNGVAGDVNRGCNAIETMYEEGGAVRLLTGGIDEITDVDYQQGFGTEQNVVGTITTHPWGNDSAQFIKRPSWFRFTTNRDPSYLANDGWSFAVLGADDDYYTIAIPLALNLTPGVNDALTLGGFPPSEPYGTPFKGISQGVFRVGGVNFVMGRRLQFTVNFPEAPGVFELRQIQIEYAPSPPR